jgi:O-antigen/teichoic acid export membrane protein
MSRARRAIVAASFTYVQFGLAIVSGLILVPLLLSRLGARTYGLWLVSGELLGYAAMLDLGVLALLPWLVAQADGAKDQQAVRRLLVHGFALGTLAGVAVTGLAAVVWWMAPTVLRLTEGDRAMLAGPLGVVVVATAVTYPARIFNAVLVGLQDFRFTGLLAVVQVALNVTMTITLLLSGYGLYALAAGVVVPSAVTTVASLIRLRLARPDLLRDWPWPTRAGMLSVVPEGLGAWLSTLGWQMAAASHGLIIAFLGHAELVAVYACTAKLSQLLFQLSRVLPDSGLVALAQLRGEGQRDRIQNGVMTILRLHLVLSGAAAAVLLAFNPAFVRWWVGAGLFGGLTLNGVLATSLVLTSLTHGLVCSTAVLGNRLVVGGVTLVYGLLNLALAAGLGAVWGLLGVAAAPVVSGLLTTLPLGLRLLGPVTGLSVHRLATDLWIPWLMRVVPLLLAATTIGLISVRLLSGYVGSVMMLGLITVAGYVWWMRPLYRGLPLDPTLRGWLIRLRLDAPVAATPLERSAP